MWNPFRRKQNDAEPKITFTKVETPTMAELEALFTRMNSEGWTSLAGPPLPHELDKMRKDDTVS